MSKANAVAEHLPYPHRYARALGGSQASGDAYVAATLQAIVKDLELLESAFPLRVTLYRLFSTVWNSVSVNETAEPVTDVTQARHGQPATMRGTDLGSKAREHS
jgi:response regulator PhyR-like protein